MTGLTRRREHGAGLFSGRWGRCPRPGGSTAGPAAPRRRLAHDLQGEAVAKARDRSGSRCFFPRIPQAPQLLLQPLPAAHRPAPEAEAMAEAEGRGGEGKGKEGREGSAGSCHYLWALSRPGRRLAENFRPAQASDCPEAPSGNGSLRRGFDVLQSKGPESPRSPLAPSQLVGKPLADRTCLCLHAPRDGELTTSQGRSSPG